jgi:hypothetical protein
MATKEMPSWYYVIIHPEARLADKDRQALVTWAGQGTAGRAPVAPGPNQVGTQIRTEPAALS